MKRYIRSSNSDNSNTYVVYRGNVPLKSYATRRGAERYAREYSLELDVATSVVMFKYGRSVTVWSSEEDRERVYRVDPNKVKLVKAMCEDIASQYDEKLENDKVKLSCTDSTFMSQRKATAYLEPLTKRIVNDCYIASLNLAIYLDNSPNSIFVYVEVVPHEVSGVKNTVYNYAPNSFVIYDNFNDADLNKLQNIIGDYIESALERLV